MSLLSNASREKTVISIETLQCLFLLPGIGVLIYSVPDLAVTPPSDSLPAIRSDQLVLVLCFAEIKKSELFLKLACFEEALEFRLCVYPMCRARVEV